MNSRVAEAASPSIRRPLAGHGRLGPFLWALLLVGSAIVGVALWRYRATPAGTAFVAG